MEHESTNKRVIVCIDENYTNLNSLRIMLNMVGYTGAVKCFKSSQKALDYISNRVLLTTRKPRTKLEMVILESDL